MFVLITYSTGSAFSDTFQMIAFLMSIFNMVTILSSTKTDANNNNNNNNNNRNDNSANANQNNVNEGNANADVNAMNLIVPVGRSMAQRLLDFWNGVRRKKRSGEEFEFLPQEIRCYNASCEKLRTFGRSRKIIKRYLLQ